MSVTIMPPKHGENIVLKGKTRHGKNRIQQHGMEWVVKEIGTFHGHQAMSLRSQHKTEGPKHNKGFDSRWVLLKEDPNFLWFSKKDLGV